VDLQETRQWILNRILLTLAPPQRFENAPEKVWLDHQTNGFSQWLLRFIICEKFFFEPALPNGPSSPAPCDRNSTHLLRLEKATTLLKMRLNYIFSLRTVEITS